MYENNANQSMSFITKQTTWDDWAGDDNTKST
jgi:hypothetical protein